MDDRHFRLSPPRRLLHRVTTLEQRQRFVDRFGNPFRLVALVAATARHVRRRAEQPVVAAGVVGSLTTHPGRLHVAHHAIRALLSGSVVPERTVLWLARDEVPPSCRLPRGLRALLGRGLEIRWVDENFGPANKLVHALEAFPDHAIMVIDDDILHPPESLEALLRSRERDPDAIWAHLVQRVIGSPDEPATLGLGDDPEVSAPGLDLVPLGTSGVLYPPRSLHPAVADCEAYARLSPDTDDLWFWLHACRRGTHVGRTAEGPDLAPSATVWTQRTALWRVNRQTGLNRRNLARMLAHHPEIAAQLAACRWGGDPDEGAAPSHQARTSDGR